MDSSPRVSSRLSAILPLKITVGSEVYTHLSHTLDISASGLKVIMPLPLDPGCDVVLEYKKNRARAVVVWSKRRSNTSRDFVTGMRLLDDGQRFWLVDLGPKARVLASNGRNDTERSRDSRERDAV